MAKATSTTREYVTMRIAEDLGGLGASYWEDLGLEVAANPAEARSIARGRFPEDQQSGIYVAIASGSFAPHAGGKRMVWVDDETPLDPRDPNPPVAKDSNGKAPLKGQADLPAVGVPVHGTEVPRSPTGTTLDAEAQAQEAVTPPPAKDGVPIDDLPVVAPDPVTIVPDPEAAATPTPEVAAPPTEDEKAQAKAAREARIKENARKYAEAQAQATQAPPAAAVAERMEAEAKGSAETAEHLAQVEAERKARVAAEKEAARDETPPTVNADDGWSDPSAVDDGWGPV